MSVYSERKAQNLAIVARAFRVWGLDPAIGCGIAEHESYWKVDAHSAPGATDDALGGAFGLCQMTLETARSLGFTGTPDELFNPYTNALLAASYCAQNAKLLGDDPAKWVAAYNCGPGHVRAGTIPRVTSHVYVPDVLARAEKLRAEVTEALAAIDQKELAEVQTNLA